MIQVENYLKAERATGKDQGERTILNIMARIGLTEGEVLQASFTSKKIHRKLKPDKDGFADKIMLWYDETT